MSGKVVAGIAGTVIAVIVAAFVISNVATSLPGP